MKTIFDTQTADELIARIEQLHNNSQPAWGKMTLYQMIKHCSMWEEMLLQKQLYKQTFLGRLFGKFALKDMMKDEPAKKNLPTVPSFRITGEGDAQVEKQRWISLILEHRQRQNEGFMHPFFGQLTADQAGRMDYKHIDHHLRQFGA